MALKTYPSKTEVSTFHLNNKKANYQQNVLFSGVTLNHNFNPTILGVKMDRSLTYKAHLESKANKLCTRNNILMNLAGTTWGASVQTFRTSALAIVFLIAEYCCSMRVPCGLIVFTLLKLMSSLTGQCL